MSDRTVYERALRELADCERRATELRGFVRMYEELAGRPALSVSRPDAGRPLELVPTPDVERTVDGTLTEAVMVSRALDAIEREGRPLDRKELACSVFGVDDPSVLTDRVLNNLGSRLSRSDRFVNFAKMGKPGYWPKDKPYEPYGYRPSQEESSRQEEGQPERQASPESATDANDRDDGNGDGLFRATEGTRERVNVAPVPYRAS